MPRKVTAPAKSARISSKTQKTISKSKGVAKPSPQKAACTGKGSKGKTPKKQVAPQQAPKIRRQRPTRGCAQETRSNVSEINPSRQSFTFIIPPRSPRPAEETKTAAVIVDP